MLADEGDDRLVVPIEVVPRGARRAAGEQHDRLAVLPRPRELPDTLIVGLELLEARQGRGDGGTGMCACLVPVKPEKPHGPRVRAICLHGRAERGVVLAEIPGGNVNDGLRLVLVGQRVRISPSRVGQEAALVGVQAVADRPGLGRR